MATRAITGTPAAKARETQVSGTAKRRIRKIFGDIHEVVDMPNLIEVQRESYEQFLRSDKATGYVSGLEKTLRSVFPIRDFAGTAELDFVHYELEPPKYDIVECRQRGITYAAPMKVTLRLIVFEVDQETETRSVLDIKEQDVYMGDMPLMTENGTFVINGTERVIVSQMHRSPGVLFDHDRGKTHSSGKLLFAARIIPYRGSWLDFEFDAKDIVNVRIDRKRKLPVTTLLFALGYTRDDVANLQYGLRKLRALELIRTTGGTNRRNYEYEVTPAGRELTDRIATIATDLVFASTRALADVERKLVASADLMRLMTGIFDEAARVAGTFSPASPIPTRPRLRPSCRRRTTRSSTPTSRRGACWPSRIPPAPSPTAPSP